MDVVLTYTSSLALVRAARASEELSLRESALTRCPDSCPSGATLDELLAYLGPLLGDVSASRPLELAISRQSRRPHDARLLARVRTGDLPAGSYLELVDGRAKGAGATHRPRGVRILVESPALALVSRANGIQPQVRSGRIDRWLVVDMVIALGMELCGAYSRSAVDPLGGRCAYKVAPVASAESIAGQLANMRGIRGLGMATRAVAHIADGSASSMETLHLMMETLPPRLAGLSMGSPALNHRIVPTPQQRRVLSLPNGMRPDLFWKDYGVAIEHDGEEGHRSTRGWRSDHERVQDYQVCGIKVFPATYEDVRSVAHLNAFALKVCNAIADAGNTGMGKRVRVLMRDEAFRARQRELLAYLLPPVGER